MCEYNLHNEKFEYNLHNEKFEYNLDNNNFCENKLSKQWFSSLFFRTLFFNIKNNTYEVTTMWCLIVTTIIILLLILIKGLDDEAETERAVLGIGIGKP